MFGSDYGSDYWGDGTAESTLKEQVDNGKMRLFFFIPAIVGISVDNSIPVKEHRCYLKL